jgi:cell division protein FtsI (penicillin-binding protein 3)
MTARPGSKLSRARVLLVLGFFGAALGLLAARAVYLQVVRADYLQDQGQQRHSRLVKDNSHRGMILDRFGAPLAVSTPVDSVWAHPATLAGEKRHWPALARALELTPKEIAQMLAKHDAREFMYLKRHVTPDVAERVRALDVAGVSLLREYRRYYPAGASAAHVVGFTNVDDVGQEGIELAHDARLRAVPGQKRVLKDLHGNTVEAVESVVLPKPGRDLTITLDLRIQYLAYRELKAAVAEHRARAGTAIVLDARTGEVLALANEPDFNPNNRAALKSQTFRNRAVTDLYEPGSTLKPFTVAAGIESGRFTARTPIDTAPGAILVGTKTIRDAHNNGLLTVAGVLERSSNVGMTKIAFALSKTAMWETVRRAGFGTATGVGLPGEQSGLLNPPTRWAPIDQATLSFGYGISVTPLQLARAYAVIANGGRRIPLLLTRPEPGAEPVEAVPVFSERTARELVSMLALSAGGQGTGAAAQVADYRVAGKTGTVRKLIAGGYQEERHIAWFAGMAPASDPRLVMVVMIDEPVRGGYFGGVTAAPVFSRVMAGALRLLDIPADAPRHSPKPVNAVARGRDA